MNNGMSGWWQPASQVGAPVCSITAETTLVIIDVQDWYLERDLRPEAVAVLVPAVLREIDAAKAVGADILYVEYGPDSPTDSRIRSALRWYPRWKRKRVEKSGMSGAAEVLDACNEYGFNERHLRLCGIFTNLCVYFTALHLSCEPNTRVEVVVDACCTETSAYDWEEYRRQEAMNIHLVRQPRTAA
jgi:nicotinamidase-related amidase